jgi:hypothetical protein
MIAKTLRSTKTLRLMRTQSLLDNRTGARYWPLALTTLTLLATAASVPLSVAARQSVLGNSIQNLVSSLPYAAVGIVVIRKLPRNPVGWLLAGIGILSVLSTDAGSYALLAHRHGSPLPLGLAAAWLDESYRPAAILFPLAILLFPDGRLASARWRWVLRSYLAFSAAYVVVLVVSTLSAAASHGSFQIDAAGGLTAIDWPHGWSAAVEAPGLALYVAAWVTFIARQVVSWRTADGNRRQQLKWLMAGATVAVVSLAGSLIGGIVAPNAPAVLRVDVGPAIGVLIAALPVGMGVAILRYRLYDIDRIISRTLAYAVITALLAGLYAGLVLLATEVLDLTSQVAVAAATLAAAALFNPLRRRVQHRVDRRFNRARYDADNTVAAFAARLQDATDPDAVRSDLMSTVHHALEPAHVTLWITGGTG